MHLTSSSLARFSRCAASLWLLLASPRVGLSQPATVLPSGVESVWDVREATRETTFSRERICINGLWRWQPALTDQDTVPNRDWGYFKVPGCWPGITNYMQKDCQTVFAHPAWEAERLSSVTAAWYERTVAVPQDWQRRRIVLRADCVNSLAVVYVDGKRAGELRYPGGELDLSTVCQPGATHQLALHVFALPLKAVMLSFRDTAAAKQIQGRVARRGLCGDVYLESSPSRDRIGDVRLATSVRDWQLRLDVALNNLNAGRSYRLEGVVRDGNQSVHSFRTDSFSMEDLTAGRLQSVHDWRPPKLWDLHTPENQYLLSLTLLDADGAALDRCYDVVFGFREFWIDGRDFILNGQRIFLSSVPLDNAQIGAAWASYEAARESMLRLQSFGINYVYTHNYGCEPGSHLAFEEILKAADDVGMLIGLSQPHFAHYDWQPPQTAETNGYAQHAAYYCAVAGAHPSVVAYATSHNATGYAEDMNPDMIDGVQAKRSKWSTGNVTRARLAENIIRSIDPERIVYHHASGNLGQMHTTNFYANFAPIQEMSDWFEHWSTEGVKPLFTCEYSVPLSWDWTMYRGWYEGEREFGSARVPWEFCLAEWNAQFLGDKAYQVTEEEKENLRWEARQFAAGNRWHRWDYPHVVGSNDFEQRDAIFSKYFRQNWPAFRTWGVSAIAPWNHGYYWRVRDNVDRGRQRLSVDWPTLQRPGFSADYVDDRYERMDIAFERSDWEPTAAGTTLIRYNGPLLAYLAGPPSSFTSQQHHFVAGETVEKQLILINNSRRTVTCDCQWSLTLPEPQAGGCEVTLKTGQQLRVPLRFALPDDLATGTYALDARVRFTGGPEVAVEEAMGEQRDTLSLHIVPRPRPVDVPARVALFDPQGETRQLLAKLDIDCQTVEADVDLSPFSVLVVGKRALTVDGRAPNLRGVKDGLKVVVFEQSPEVLERRMGFRVATYGLRSVFPRIPGHPILSGIEEQHLRDWRGAATIVPPRLNYTLADEYNGVPAVRWCGMISPRLWRCGNRGNVATVLIEKPQRGDFLPVVDGGYSLQYSPLIEYREGRGLVLFCQLDVTGRTEDDPAAAILAGNALQYVMQWQPAPKTHVAYVGNPQLKQLLESSGLRITPYTRDGLNDTSLCVVGSGGWKSIADEMQQVTSWLKRGGRLVALDLDPETANQVLPGQFSFRFGEHISGYFESQPFDSPFRGIGAADLHNAAPCELALVSNQRAVGNGVLAVNADGSIIVCQLTPDRFTYDGKQRNVKRTFRRVSFLVSRLLANQGASSETPILEWFSDPVAQDGLEAERWLKGLYADEPELWDDPYRFFRW